MNTADYLVIALIVISGIAGLVRGFLREIIALLSWVFALLIAWHFAALLEPQLGGLLGLPQVRPWAARGILLLLVVLIGAGIGALTVQLVRLPIFSPMDRFLGLVVGALRGLVMLGVLVLFCQMLHLDGERWWHRSVLLPYGEGIAGALRALVGDPRKRDHDVAVFNYRSR
jgi:membrane protein required for colicin V production